MDTEKEVTLTDTTLQIQLDYSIEAVTDKWDDFIGEQNYFLTSNYLKAIETCPPKGMQFAYVSFWKNHDLIGVAYAQILHFNTYESLENHPSFINQSGWALELKKWFAQKIDFHAIVCGNVLMTGEHGFYFEEHLGQTDQIALLHAAMSQLQKVLKTRGLQTSVTVFKDYFEGSRKKLQHLPDYAEFCIQPNMVLDISPDWKKIEDYLGAMSSKYRVRAKRAFKKGKDITKKELDVQEMQALQDEIYTLYQNVVESAGFSGIELQKGYFLNLKQTLCDKFKVIGYFLEGKIIGFYTVFINNDELETHYLGLDFEYNHSLQSYLNMLYDMVKMGIYHQVQRVVFARTALEIKSSVGATPREMYCYMRHRNSLYNPLVKPVFEWFNPKEEWVQRHPFK